MLLAMMLLFEFEVTTTSNSAMSQLVSMQEDIIIDAKSGVSGAGRSAKQAFLYTEVAGGMNAYGVSRHRHMPEIEQVRETLKDVRYGPALYCTSKL